MGDSGCSHTYLSHIRDYDSRKDMGNHIPTKSPGTQALFNLLNTYYQFSHTHTNTHTQCYLILTTVWVRYKHYFKRLNPKLMRYNTRPVIPSTLETEAEEL